MTVALSRDDLLGLVHDSVLKDAKAQWGKLRIQRMHLDGLLTKSWTPDGADAEYKDLMRKARSPWLRYASQVIAQGLVVDGYSDTRVWDEVWQASGMDGRQSALADQIVGYGYGYLLTFPAEGGGALMRPLSVHSTFAWSEDPWQDTPDLVMHQVSNHLWRVFDAEAMYEVRGSLDRPEDVTVVEHDAGVNPVTLIPAKFALEGLPDSLVMQGLPAYKRIVDATFALQMLQRYAGFPQKWQSGGEIGTDENGNALIRPSVDSILHSDDPTSRFGNFAPVDLTQAIAAVDKNIEDLAVFTQIPPHYLLGKVVNLSSDALAATETAYNRLVESTRDPVGEGYEQAMRIGARLIGDEAAALNLSSEIHWRETAVRALGASVDAVQKLHVTGMPRKYSYRLVPGMSKADIDQAAKAADEANPITPSGVRDDGGTSRNIDGSTEASDG